MMTVTEAQDALSKAKAAEAAEQRQENVKRLGEVRQAKRDAEHDLEELTTEVINRQTAWTQVQALIEGFRDTLCNLDRDRPECLDILPDDPDVVRWNRVKKQHEASLAEAIAYRDALPPADPLRLEGVRLAHRLQELEYAEANLLRSIKGELPGHKGGIFAVR